MFNCLKLDQITSESPSVSSTSLYINKNYLSILCQILIYRLNSNDKSIVDSTQIDIVLMWVFILLTIFSFGKISSLSAWLLVPYISWVSFAAVLNFAIWRMN